MDERDIPIPHDTPEPGDPGLAREAAALAILAGALAASVVVYPGIAWFLTSEASDAGFQPSGLPAPLPAILAGLGIVLLLVAPVVEGRLRSGTAGEGGERAVQGFRTATLVGFALRETAAVLGLVIAITTGRPLWCYLLSLAALVAMVSAWPSRSRLERHARGAVRPS
ncbi:MAG: hypothetical protein ACLF0P_04055 [Thermoanaerobaculia bacterium]